MTKDQNIERLAYSVREVAATIGVSSRTLHDYIKNGDIAHFRIGTRVLIPVEALREFVASRVQAEGLQQSPPNNREEMQS